jgi:serine protease Do
MTKKAVLTLSGLLLLAPGITLRAQDAPAAPPAPAAAPAVVTVAPTAPPQAAAVVAPAPPAQRVSAASVVPQAAPPALAPAQAAPPSAVLAPAAAPTRALPAMVYAPAAPPQGPGEVTIFQFGDNFLGVSVEDVTRENMGRYQMSGEPRGVGVRSVVKGSPAEKAGLRENDVILRFDGEAVTTTRKLNRLLGESAPEHTARLTIRRGGSEQEISVTLGKREFGREFGGTMIDGDLLRRQAEEMSKNSEMWKRQGEDARRKLEELQRKNPGGVFTFFGGGRRVGISTNALGKQLADYFGVSHGALVTSVEPDSPAARAGLKAGDIVTEVDGERVEDSGDLSRAINRKDEGEVTLTVVRERNRRTVRVTPEKMKSPGGELFPGGLRIEAPSIAISLPQMRLALPTIDLNLRLPPINIQPRTRVTPRVIRPRSGQTIL